MESTLTKRDEFYEELAKLPREKLLQIIGEQNPILLKHVERIEFVFSNKLKHLSWADGTSVLERQTKNSALRSGAIPLAFIRSSNSKGSSDDNYRKSSPR